MWKCSNILNVRSSSPFGYSVVGECTHTHTQHFTNLFEYFCTLTIFTCWSYFVDSSVFMCVNANGSFHKLPFSKIWSTWLHHRNTLINRIIWFHESDRDPVSLAFCILHLDKWVKHENWKGQHKPKNFQWHNMAETINWLRIGEKEKINKFFQIHFNKEAWQQQQKN